MSEISFREGSYISLNSTGYSNIVYSDWGNIDHPIILAVHGLSCNARDFDVLASNIVKNGYRFIGIDLPGRGRSDYLDNYSDYCHEQYLRDISAIFPHLNITKPKSIDFLGVSLGGLLGMRLASAKNSPIKRLIINDVGPEIPAKAIERLKTIFSKQYIFNSVGELKTALKLGGRSTWGYLTEDQWDYMAENNACAMSDGRITFAYDFNIIQSFMNEPEGKEDLWGHWNKLDIPILLLRGAKSDILPFETAVEMKRKIPDLVTLKEFENCGHAPSLMYKEHIDSILEWLFNTSHKEQNNDSPVVMEC